jgi:16S rRNA (adenine1518-N6/adenine1519-N6)-dimethyltransferase
MIHKAKKSLVLKKFFHENFSPETSSFKAKKSLGQNFLKSEPALRAMCESGNVNEKDIVLEIGPGKGALTKKLLEKAGTVIAIEKDRDLFEILKDKFQSEIKNKKLILVEDDILGFNPATYNLMPLNYKVIANIPYNITGAVFKNFLSNDIQPNTMVLLVQKEVAERIVARDNKESILSLSVKVYGDPKYIMKVGKRFFSPEPKIDSAIIAINNISNKNFKNKNYEKVFFDIIKTGFAHKRKVLRKNLESGEVKLHHIDEIFEKLKINPKTRAEDVRIDNWLKISSYLSTDI